MQMLFQWEMGGNTPEQVGASFFFERKANGEVQSFARQLFQGTVGEVDRVDKLVRGHAKNWRLERMAAVDRSILRMSVYELLCCPETPPQVVIDEALEIARRFSGNDSVQFVNGVLDSILKSLPPRSADDLRPHQS